MENNQLQRVSDGTPAFIADAMSSLQKMEAYADLLIQSGLVPNHFYELDQYRKPLKDAQGRFKGNRAAVIMTIQHGLEMGMTITQALQQIVPINGLLAVKGDGASSQIKTSGKLAAWKETKTGSIEKEDYAVTIYAKRTDGTELTETFTVARAKRLGLWITPDMLAKNDKLRHGGWWKTPERMIRYRALGFIARDLFPDVMQGAYTEDEARDLHEDYSQMTTENGMTLKISGDTKGSAMNEAAAAALDAAPVPATATKPRATRKAAPVPVQQPETTSDAEVMTDEQSQPTGEKKYEGAELLLMSPKELMSLAKEVMGFDLNEVLFKTDTSKRTKPNVAKLIMAKQDGMQATVLANVFGVDLRSLNTQGEQSSTKEETSAVEAEESAFGNPPREFDKQMDVFDTLTDSGVEDAHILQYIKDNGLTFTTSEDMIKNAPGSVISKMIEDLTAE